MMSKEEREESRAICEKATPGPWDYDEGDHSIHSLEDNQPPVTCDYWTGYDCGSVVFGVANAAFIAHARTALPKALDALEEAEAEYMGLLNELREEKADRDRWKAHANELFDIALVARACGVCMHRETPMYSPPCRTCDPLHNRWELDGDWFEG